MTQITELAHPDGHICESCGCEVVVVSDDSATVAWLECDCGRVEILLWEPAARLITAA